MFFPLLFSIHYLICFRFRNFNQSIFVFMSKRRLSLKDLAKELNISISTVSRALKNHPDISVELTRRVQELALEKNYTPNPLAMGLLRQETKMIGVIVPDLVTHFYSSIISGIEEYAKSQGYFILLASSDENLDKEIESVRNCFNAIASPCYIVLIHDGARPFVDKKIIVESIRLADKYGACITVISIVLSVIAFFNSSSFITPY